MSKYSPALTKLLSNTDPTLSAAIKGLFNNNVDLLTKFESYANGTNGSAQLTQINFVTDPNAEKYNAVFVKSGNGSPFFSIPAVRTSQNAVARHTARTNGRARQTDETRWVS